MHALARGGDAEAVPEPDSLVGGRYRVERVLGHGGSSVVVAAVDEQTGARVAVKQLRLRDPTARERLLREARLLARLESEHITALLDFGTSTEGDPYLVTQLVEGSDLAVFLRERGPLSIRDAIEIVCQACTGLHAAHSQGIVHRDIKPANVLVTHRLDGTLLVKLVDFGISRAVAGPGKEATLTESGYLLGTPHYMAPEQIKNARTADARADVYSLGVILYRLLTLEYPFDGETAGEVIMNVASTPPPSLRARRPDAPASLDAVVRRCISRSVNARVQSVTELEASLRAVLDGSLRGKAMLHHDALGTPGRRAGDAPMAGAAAVAPTLAAEPTTIPLLSAEVPIRRRRRWWLTAGGLVALSCAIGLGAMRRADSLPAAAGRSEATTHEPPPAAPTMPPPASAEPAAVSPSTASGSVGAAPRPGAPTTAAPRPRASRPASHPTGAAPRPKPDPYSVYE